MCELFVRSLTSLTELAALVPNAIIVIMIIAKMMQTAVISAPRANLCPQEGHVVALSLRLF